MVHLRCLDSVVDSTSKNRLIMIGDVFVLERNEAEKMF